jgi:hypothetical protein
VHEAVVSSARLNFDPSKWRAALAVFEGAPGALTAHPA